MQKYKHILFDLDRTLWDFESNSRITLKYLYDKYSINQYYQSFDVYFQVYHDHNSKLWKEYREGNLKKEILRWKRFYLPLSEKGVENEELAHKMGEDYVGESPKQTILFPNTIETLEYLSKKYSMYILTNGFKEVQHIKLDNCKLTRFFKKVFTSKEIGYQKPRKEFFEHAVSSVNAKKEECLMIGDEMEIDILGAKNFGIDQIYFNPNKISNKEIVTYEIKDLAELQGIL